MKTDGEQAPRQGSGMEKQKMNGSFHRRIRIAAALAVLFSLLCAGCGTGAASSSGKEMTIRISMYNDIAYSEWRTYVEKQFPDVAFIWENNRNSTQNLLYQAKHGDMADIVMIRRYESDSAAELAPYLMSLNKNEQTSSFSEGMLDPFTFDGKVCWYPAPGMVESIYANASLFERSGIKIPETVSELETACTRFRELGIDGLSIEASLGYRSALMLEGFNYGGCFSTEEGKAWLKEFLSGRNTKLPEDVCSQMSSVLRELSDHCVLEKSDLELQTADALSSFDAEKCAMIISGSDNVFTGKTGTDYQVIPCLGRTKDDRVLFTYPVFSTAVSGEDEKNPERKAEVEKILKVMYSPEAQQVLASGADTLISYNTGIELPIGSLYQNLKDLIQEKKTFIRFLNRNMFSASSQAISDIVQDGASDGKVGEDFNSVLNQPADTTVIGKSNVQAGCQLGEVYPLEREAASVIAQSVQKSTGADAVLIEGKSAAGPIYTGNYTEDDLNAAVADEKLWEGSLTGAQLASVFDGSILATTTYRYKALEPLVDYPALAGVKAVLYANGTDNVLQKQDGTALDPAAVYDTVLSQTIYDALQYLGNKNIQSFGEIDLTLQKCVSSGLAAGNLPKPEKYFEMEAAE